LRQAPSALHIRRPYREERLEGLHGPRYYGEFNNWYVKAMEQGEADVQFKIGECLNAGIVVPQDGDEAASWYHRAASQGHPDAQYRLGLYLKDHFEEQVVRALSKTFVRC